MKFHKQFTFTIVLLERTELLRAIFSIAENNFPDDKKNKNKDFRLGTD